MLDKLQAVADRFEELCARSEQPDFYNDPKKAAAILRERNDLEPIIETYQSYRDAQRDLLDAQELMSDPEMKELCQQTYQDAKVAMEEPANIKKESAILKRRVSDTLMLRNLLATICRAINSPIIAMVFVDQRFLCVISIFISSWGACMP